MLKRFRPKPATRYPADPRAVFVLSLCIASGVPLLLTDDFSAGSLETQLPHWGVVVWGISLVVGAIVTLGGMTKQTTNGIIVEQVGSAIVGAATLFYSGVILWTLHLDGAVATPFILGFGLSCFWRWGQLQALLVNEYHRRLLAEVQLAGQRDEL